MGSFNKAIVVGNLGADPEIKYLPNGNAVTNLSLATTDTWKDKNTGQKQERTEWHRISFFGRSAETIAEYATKGPMLLVEGSIQTRKWQDKEGADRYTTEIKGDRFQFLGGGSGERKERPAQAEEPEPQPEAKPAQDDFDDDLPF